MPRTRTQAAELGYTTPRDWCFKSIDGSGGKWVDSINNAPTIMALVNGKEKMRAGKIVKQGYLLKRSVESKRNWRKRYFVLFRGSLQWYKGTQSVAAKGMVVLNETCRVEEVKFGDMTGIEDLNRFQMDLFSPTLPKDGIRMEAEDGPTLARWLRALKATINATEYVEDDALDEKRKKIEKQGSSRKKLHKDKSFRGLESRTFRGAGKNMRKHISVADAGERVAHLRSNIMTMEAMRDSFQGSFANAAEFPDIDTRSFDASPASSSSIISQFDFVHRVVNSPGTKSIDDMSVAELRHFIQACGLDHNDCLEKSDLRKRAIEAGKKFSESSMSTSSSGSKKNEKEKGRRSSDLAEDVVSKLNTRDLGLNLKSKHAQAEARRHIIAKTNSGHKQRSMSRSDLGIVGRTRDNAADVSSKKAMQDSLAKLRALQAKMKTYNKGERKANVQPPSLEHLSVKELKKIIAAKGRDASTAISKADLIKLARD